MCNIYENLNEKLYPLNISVSSINDSFVYFQLLSDSKNFKFKFPKSYVPNILLDNFKESKDKSDLLKVTYRATKEKSFKQVKDNTYMNNLMEIQKAELRNGIKFCITTNEKLICWNDRYNDG